ncbi:hypothetical protein CYMTET_5278 [Cymbomonas tetramitiformis]|uniref:Uncharacterized protein n=1 Tax=Cymbomonas tetramitiformis TaxID=36881 RepID=A0AAE0GZN2_9CHLO|nr:hypothetical protein CYMTET_5278 [Cymbomonas tetramitiformis]
MEVHGRPFENPLYVPAASLEDAPADVLSWLEQELGDLNLMACGGLTTGASSDFSNPLYVPGAKLSKAPTAVQRWFGLEVEADSSGPDAENLGQSKGYTLERAQLQAAPQEVVDWLAADPELGSLLMSQEDAGEENQHDFSKGNPLYMPTAQLMQAPPEVCRWFGLSHEEIQSLKSGDAAQVATPMLDVQSDKLMSAPDSVKQWFGMDSECNLLMSHAPIEDDSGETMNPYYASDAQLIRAPKEVKHWFGLDEDFNLMMADRSEDDLERVKPFFMTDEQLAMAPVQVRHYFGRDELQHGESFSRRRSVLGEESVNPYYTPGARLNRAPSNLRQWFGVDENYNLAMGEAAEEEETVNPLFTQAAKLTHAPTGLRHQFHPAFQRESPEYNLLMGTAKDGAKELEANPLFDPKAKVRRASVELHETFVPQEDFQERHAEALATTSQSRRNFRRTSKLDFDALEKGLKHIAEEEEDVHWTQEDSAKAKGARRKRRSSVGNAAHVTSKLFTTSSSKQPTRRAVLSSKGQEEAGQWNAEGRAQPNPERSRRRSSVSEFLLATTHMFARSSSKQPDRAKKSYPAAAAGATPGSSADAKGGEMEMPHLKKEKKKKKVSLVDFGKTYRTLKVSANKHLKWVQGADGGRYLINADNTGPTEAPTGAGASVKPRRRQSIMETTGRRLSLLFSPSASSANV